MSKRRHWVFIPLMTIPLISMFVLAACGRTPSGEDTGLISIGTSETELPLESQERVKTPEEDPHIDSLRLTTEKPPSGNLETPISSPTRVTESAIQSAVITQELSDKPLTEAGPWLLFQSRDGLWILNADGSGMSLIYPEPPLGWTGQAAQISPDGTRAAFITGNGTNTETLILHILHLPEGEVEAEIDLTEYEFNPDEFAEGFYPGEVWKTVLGPNGFRWSPNGYYLAFVGAIEGPSPDVYEYNTADRGITRLTSGESEAWDLHWSPTSKYIVHTAGYTGTGAGDNIHGIWASRIDGSGNEFLYKPPKSYFDETDELGTQSGDEILLYWISEDEFVVMSWYVSFGEANLRTFDISEKQMTSLIDGWIREVEIDPLSNTALVTTFDRSVEGDPMKSGVFLVNLDGSGKVQLLSQDPNDVEYTYLIFSSTKGKYVVIAPEATYALDPRAPRELKEITREEIGNYYSDAEYTYSAGVNIERSTLIIDGDGFEDYEISSEPIFDWTWNPDHDAIIYLTDGASNDLYVASAPDFNPQLIAQSISLHGAFGVSFVWAERW